MFNFPAFIDPYDLFDEDKKPDLDGDDFEYLDMCPDCRGSGKYTGFLDVQTCTPCDGSGWLGKGQGWTREQYWAYLDKRKDLENHGL